MPHSAVSHNGSDVLLAEIIEDFTNRVRAGESVDVESYAQKHPEHAARLRQLLPALALLDDLGRSASAVAAKDPASSREGSLSGVLGDFRIVREVGKGGMGVVYEAEQISLRRRVALKVLPFTATMDARHLQRFHNEAQAAACLHHTNIVPVFSVGCERGIHFYAMQFIDGQPLSDLIQQMRQLENKEPTAGDEGTIPYQPSPGEVASTPLPAVEMTPLTGEGRRNSDYYRKVAELGIQAAEALDHAHQLGIVHRDIKPGNLMLDGMGRLWVTDFGLAQVQHSEANLTLTGQALGTPRYMSPEQALAKRVPIDHRTDVYSLGVTLYELLTLRPAFTSEDRHELLRQIAFEEPAKPRRLERAIPAELETIVFKAMEKRPQDRYATAQELANDLERWLKHEPIRARRPTPTQRASKWVRRHQTVTAASAVVLLMVLILAGYIGWVRYDRELHRRAGAQVILAALRDSQDWQEKRRLPEALSAAQRAADLLAGVEVDEELQQRVRGRLKDLELLDRLESILLEMAETVKDLGPDREAIDRLLGKTFNDERVDVDALTASEAGERFGRWSTVKAELAGVLDSWAAIRSQLRGHSDPSWKHLFRVARAVDADPWRARVREALERSDRRALEDLSASDEVIHLPPEILYTVATVLREKGAVQQAEELLREAQRRHPDDYWLNEGLYQFYSGMQPPRWEEALRYVSVAVALRPRSPGAHFNLGHAMKATERFDEAIAEYRSAIRLKADIAEAHHSLGHLLIRKGRVEEGITEYKEAIRLKKDYADAYYNLGVVLKDNGQRDEAIAAYREAIRYKHDFAEAHTNLGTSLYSQGHVDEAIAEFREALKKSFPEAYKAHDHLGNALRDKGQLEEAITEYKEAIRLQKDFVEAHNHLGIALAGKGQLDEAITEFRESIRLKDDNAGVHSNYGTALFLKGRLEEAIDEYRKSLKLDKDNPKVHISLGNALRNKGRLDEAIAAYQQAIRLNNDFADAHCSLGSALELKGQFAEALVCYRRGHELGSKNPRWSNPSAQRVRSCERLVELDGKLPAILSGQVQPADTAERLALAELCQMPCKKLSIAALRFYKEAFADKPQLLDDLNAQHRYNAACVAARAGYGPDADADKLDAKERSRLRQQALDWLRADLKAYRQVMEKSAGKNGPAIAQRMQHWLQDEDFAGVRGAESLAKLSEDERKEWHKLWQEAEALRQRAAQPPNK